MNIVYLASDHAGFTHKEKVKEYLENQGFTVIDYGADTYNEQDDYPDMIYPCIRDMVEKPNTKAIIFGGSGQGEAIVANRIPLARAMVYNTPNEQLIILGREHNDANVLSIGARFVSEKDACRAVDIFLQTSFTGEERHIRRIKKIDIVL
ncbi:MAG: RpiB/LacA/LacB family sugar-phosphate isomerase [Alphaproteobacteria bacterium]|nr:RpiB/LacA/LacB family sugar-phosphate isomerase [Alphaproteobacteria bacterium]